MICPSCGADNKNGFKFCVVCGKKLSYPQELNYEKIDMGGYHSEEDFSSGNKGFTMGSGTVVVNDSGSDSSSDSSDELNRSGEEYSFSVYDEPFIPTLNTDRLSIPQTEERSRSVNKSTHYQQPFQSVEHNNNNNNQYPNNQMYGQPQQMQQTPPMYGQQQVMGYDQSGMPVYGQPQPMMYGQPQIIGYDQSGMPVYGQPQPMQPPPVYGQPQMMGYDQSGMPVYGQPQPMMYGQPPVQGYEQQYGMNHEPHGGMQGMPSMPKNNGMQSMPEPEPLKSDDMVDVPDDFWAFFDGGKATKRREPQNDDDFFGKSSRSLGMSDITSMNGSGKKNDRRNTYMSDTPLVDAGELRPNQAPKFNRMFMKNTETVDASDLRANVHEKHQDRMRVTREVDASRLNQNEHYKSRISMFETDNLGDATLEAYVPKHRKNMMAQADHAVEAFPKKKAKYIDELDLIELPEHMRAKKTKKEEKVEIPSLPEVGIEKK